MLNYTLAQITEAVSGQLHGDPQVTIESVISDSREVGPRCLFIALQGDQFDGHKFCSKAVESGACALLVDHFLSDLAIPQIRVRNTTDAYGRIAQFHRKNWGGPVVGITGSVGKTTSREVISAALSSLGPIHSNLKNYNNEIGVPQTLLSLNTHHKAAVVEMGMRSMGEIAWLAEITSPEVGVITNIGMSHIERLGSKFNIARAKRELLEFLPEGSGISVLNRDNDYFDYLSDYSSNHGSVITFGKHAKSDFRMSDILLNSLGFAKFKINEVPLEANSPGAHMPLNMACACATASALGIAFNEAIAGLATYKAPAMRLEIVLGKWETTIIDDTYNAAPDSVCSALATLQAIASTNRRSVAILGEIRELGDWSIEAHRVVGKCAGNTKLQVLIALGPATKPIVEELMSANPSAKISEFESTEAALLQLTNLIQPGDVILVKGSRALAMERIVAALKK